jgi:D-2-hydroxyacid dehydrogenase (NADP+)
MKFVAWMAYHLETREIVDDYIARIKPFLEGHELVVCEDVESVKQEIADADVMIGWRITPEVFAQAKKLRWIQFGSAGIDHTVFPELLASDVVLTTLSGIHTTVVAEHVFALMLAISRRLDLAGRLQMEQRYDRSELAATCFELAGKTLGIVGLGKIGKGIATRAKAFGMQVIGTKRDITTPVECVNELYSPDDLDKVLAVADFLVLVAPLTPATRALIGRREIGLMKPGACIVNVARGAMLDHEALGEALVTGKLRGAALDVFPEEPLPPNSPIYNLPNVIITPHTAGSHPGYSERAAEVFRANLKSFLSGGQMINVYDKTRGY